MHNNVSPVALMRQSRHKYQSIVFSSNFISLYMCLGSGKYILCSIIVINTTSTCIIKCFGFDAKISNGISLRTSYGYHEYYTSLQNHVLPNYTSRQNQRILMTVYNACLQCIQLVFCYDCPWLQFVHSQINTCRNSPIHHI